MYITKTEIKSLLKDELRCPDCFIDRLNRLGYIDQLKEVILAKEGRVEDTMKAILDEYETFCDAFGLDIEADNTKE